MCKCVCEGKEWNEDVCNLKYVYVFVHWRVRKNACDLVIYRHRGSITCVSKRMHYSLQIWIFRLPFCWLEPEKYKFGQTEEIWLELRWHKQTTAQCDCDTCP